ncbi:hypothetical protein [Alcaligenes sp. Marseille-Q7550]
MKLRALVFFFLVAWVLWAVSILWWFGGWSDEAASFGDSFGGVSALFSGLALALAIYSMLMQQKQTWQFEQATLAALEQQAQAIKLIEQSLVKQANTAQVAALTSLIAQEEQRIDDLLRWGRAAGDENKYINGIRAAKSRMETYQERMKFYAGW